MTEFFESTVERELAERGQIATQYVDANGSPTADVQFNPNDSMWAIEGITSFTTAPLRLATFSGIAIAIVAFIYLAYIVLKAAIWGDPVAGYPSLMAVILFIGGIQLLFLGIIGEYLGRVFNETKNRPVYFIESFNGEYREPEK